MKGRLTTCHDLTMSGSSQQTGAFGSQTYAVRIATGAQPGFFALGTNPTAANTDNLIGTNAIDYIKVNPGEKIAVLQAGTAGSITITEME